MKMTVLKKRLKEFLCLFTLKEDNCPKRKLKTTSTILKVLPLDEDECYERQMKTNVLTVLTVLPLYEDDCFERKMKTQSDSSSLTFQMNVT